MRLALLILLAAGDCFGDNPCPGELSCGGSDCCKFGTPYLCPDNFCYASPSHCGSPKLCTDQGGTTSEVKAQCQQAGLLYCQNPAIPKGEQCCVISVGNASASVGYLCAWGANVTPPPSCVESLQLAEDPQQGCILWGHGPPSTIVRCTR